MDIDKLCGNDSIRGWTIRKVIWGGGGGGREEGWDFPRVA